MNHVDGKIFQHLNNLELHKFKNYINLISDINIKDTSGWSILHYITYHNLEDLLEIVLKMGADVNIQNKYKKKTPLHISICNQQYEISKILLEHDANPYIKDIDGKTPLDYCQDKEFKTNIERSIKLKELHDV